MERPHMPPEENKLLLLYIIQKIGAMTNTQIIRFMIDHEYMNYLELQLTLAELTQSNYLQVLPVDEHRYYTLTSKAQQTLAFFRKHILASRREHIDAQAQNWRMLFHSERQLTADYTRSASDDYSVRLTAKEWGVTLIDLTLHVATLYQAKALCTNWHEKAADAYHVLMDALLDAQDPPQQKP